MVLSNPHGDEVANEPMRLARRAGVETFALEDEAVVYDHARDTVHFLNRTVRLVWDHCDGTRSRDVIRRELLEQIRAAESISRDSLASVECGIAEAIDLLRRDGLLEERVEP